MNRESPELSGFLQLSDQELFLYSPGSQYYFWETMSEDWQLGTFSLPYAPLRWPSVQHFPLRLGDRDKWECTQIMHVPQ